MAVRGGCLRLFSAAASTAACALAANAHEIPVPHRHLPPVTVTAPEAKPPKRVARQKPAQARGTRTARVARPEQPAAAGTGGMTPGESADKTAALQPTAASAVRFTGEEVNAIPFLRTGEALEIVPGLIVTQHSGEG